MAFILPAAETASLMANYRPLSVFEQLRYVILARMKSGEDVIPLIQGIKSAKDDVIRSLLTAKKLP